MMRRWVLTSHAVTFNCFRWGLSISELSLRKLFPLKYLVQLFLLNSQICIGWVRFQSIVPHSSLYLEYVQGISRYVLHLFLAFFSPHDKAHLHAEREGILQDFLFQRNNGYDSGTGGFFRITLWPLHIEWIFYAVSEIVSAVFSGFVLPVSLP